MLCASFVRSRLKPALRSAGFSRLCAGLPVWVLAAVALISLSLAAVYAFCSTFGKFAPFDDEGYAMLSVRGFLEGHPLYQSVFTYYGPFYYFYQWLVHALASLPLTHDVTGLLCVWHWLAAAALLALAGGVMTRSFALTLLIFLQAVSHLRSLAYEPGHPQELVSVLLALAVLVAAKDPLRSWVLPLLGGMGAVLAFTKINVGAFFWFALALALLFQTPVFQSRRAGFWAFVALSGLVPFLLMRQHLAEGWARAYAWQAGAAILGAGAATQVVPEKRALGLRALVSAGIGFACASVLLLALALLTGASLAGLLEGLILAPSKQPGIFWLPPRIGAGWWSGMAAALGAVLAVIFRARLANLLFVAIAAKGLYGLTGALVLVTHERAQFAWLLPWGWLLLLPTAPRSSGNGRDTFARLFLCLLAAWQSLQAYPVAGTQIAAATFLPVLIYSLCLHDAVTALVAAPHCRRAREARLACGLQGAERGVERGLPLAPAIFRPSLTTRTGALLQVLLLVLLLGLFALQWCNPVSAWRHYVAMKPLQLPGSRLLRLPPQQVDAYRQLAQYLGPACDTFLTYPGLNSLYFWTAKPPPTYLIVCGEVLHLDAGRQQRVVRALQRAQRPLIVVNILEAKSWIDRAASRQDLLLDLLRDEYHEVKRIGPFEIAAPKIAPELPGTP